MKLKIVLGIGAAFAAFFATNEGMAASLTPAKSYTDPILFCRVAKNADSHGEGSVSDKRYAGPENPQAAVDAIHAVVPKVSADSVVWRCMDGNMYACYLGASGRACTQFSHSLKPTRVLRGYCAQYPGTPIPEAANDTAADWTCNGITPVRDRRFPPMALDKRGYIQNAWRRVSP